MPKSRAEVATPLASRYLVLLLKHFRHKITVSGDDARGRADFPFGVCLLDATPERLAMDCEAPDAAALAQVEYVLTAHLERFAWKEKPAIVWQPVD